jgi:hypothetical protein
MFDSKEIAKQALLRADEIKEESKLRQKRWKTASILTACAACVIMVVIYFPLGMTPDGYMIAEVDPIPLSAPLLPDNNAVPYITAEGGGPVMSIPEFTIPGYDTIRIPAGAADVNMLLINPAGNPGDFTFEIILKDSGETLYKSGLVTPAMCIENITVSKPLPKGEYEAHLKINIYEPDSLNPVSIGDAGIDFILVAE